MKTLKVQAEVSQDGKLRLVVPCALPPGPVEVLLEVRAKAPNHVPQKPKWDDLYALGKEVWQGVGPLKYVQELRQDRESAS